MKVVKVEIFPASNGFFLYLYQSSEEDYHVSPPSMYGTSAPPVQTMSNVGVRGVGVKVLTEVYESSERLFNRLRELLVIPAK